MVIHSSIESVWGGWDFPAIHELRVEIEKLSDRYDDFFS